MALPTEKADSAASRDPSARRAGEPSSALGDGKVVPIGGSHEWEEDLPYRIELWRVAELKVERVLADAISAALAQAIFHEARKEYPGRVITLRYGDRIIARSDGVG